VISREKTDTATDAECELRTEKWFRRIEILVERSCGFKKNLESIFFVNAVFGWTVIGWLTAAFWAIAERKPETAKPPPVNQT
jgi:hypothetical protein